MFLSSLIPALAYGDVLFSDDYVLLRDLSPEVAVKDRAHGLLSVLDPPKLGSSWLNALWRARPMS